MMTDTILKPKTVTVEKAWDFVPVIFANGRDDDLPGLTAAFKDEKVQYRERVYQPGETLTIEGRTILMDCSHLVCIDVEGVGFQLPPHAGGEHGVAIHACGNRTTNIDNCNVMFMKPWTWRMPT